MKIQNLLTEYHHFFELKDDQSGQFKKLGWRVIHVLTGVICYPFLGAIYGIALGIHKGNSNERSNTAYPLTKSRIFSDITTPHQDKQSNKANEQMRKLVIHTEDIKSMKENEEENKPEAGELIGSTLEQTSGEIEEKNKWDADAFDKEIEKAIDNGIFDLPKGKTISDLKKDPKIMKYFLEVQKLRQEKKQDPELVKTESHILARKVAKAKFAYRLGIKPIQTSTGVHASQFMRSTSGKKVGVFKTSDLRVSNIRRTWRETCAKINVGHEVVLSEGKYAQIASEKVAFMIKSKLGPSYFSLAPVKIGHFSNETNEKTEQGAFLVFCKNASLAQMAINSINKTTFTPDEVRAYHSAFLFDFMLGNLDRHDRNWMVTTEGTKVTNVLLIDNANILPIREPSIMNFIATKARFKWKQLNVSRLPIPEEIVRDFLGILENSDSWVDSIFEQINNDHEIKKLVELEPDKNIHHYFSEKSKATMKKRVKYLKTQLQSEKITPFKIAEGYSPTL